MGAIDQDDSIVAEAGHYGHLPQRPAHVERPRQDSHHQLAERGAIARWWKHLSTHMRAEVEMGIVDPDRVRDVHRRPVDALAVAGNQVDALPDGFFDPEGAAPTGYTRTALKHVHGAQVERSRRPLGIEKPGVPCGQGLVERGAVYLHEVIL
jgi:hypothetical protein